MGSRADMTAAPLQVELDGVVYTLTPLKDRDFGEFERWVQDRTLQIAKRNMEGLSDSEKEMMLRAGIERASLITVSSPAALEVMSTIDGAAELLMLSLREKHPDITFAKAVVLCSRAEMLHACMDRIASINKSITQRRAILQSTASPDKKGGPKLRRTVGRRRILSSRKSTAGRRKRSRR